MDTSDQGIGIVALIFGKYKYVPDKGSKKKTAERNDSGHRQCQ